MAGGPRQAEMVTILNARTKCICKGCGYCDIKGFEFFGCGGCFDPKKDIAACQKCHACIVAKK